MQSRVRAAFPAPFESLELPGGQAAVLIAMRQPGCELILTRRAAHLSSHAGEVAFPGGKFDAEDITLAYTALRETHEEIGIPPGSVELVGVMPARDSRFGVSVVPFVGFVAADATLVPNEAELESVFEVPLQFFLETSPQLAHQVKYRDQEYLMPCFHWQGQIIWGLTARFIVEFVAHVFGNQLTWPEPQQVK